MPERKRQARGERRMAQLLDAAAEVFAENGYAKATTNAVAARAGVSPGTLYQFFGNKEALAVGLAERYRAALAEAHEQAFDTDHASLPLPELVDRMVDPMIAVNVANPGFKALFTATDMPTHVAAPARELHTAVAGRISSVIAARLPSLPADEVHRTAVVATQIFGALLGTILTAEDDRDRWTTELKRALIGYLAPLGATGAGTSRQDDHGTVTT
jgi:AcrR family transcriptional regulator